MEPIRTTAGSHCCNFSTRFDARLEAVPAAQAFLAQALRRNGVAADLVARGELILEELFRNSVLHGYRGDPHGAIWIGSTGDPAAFWYEDAAPAFDPLTAAPGAAGPLPGRPVDEQPVGGIGLLLIRKMARRVDYCRRDGRNLLVIAC